jgi:hypothetical protein
MIGTNYAALIGRANAVAGDIRLFVTKVNNEYKAAVYRQVVAGATTGYWYKTTIDSLMMAKIDDVSSKMTIAASGNNYEFSIPVTALDMKVAKNMNYGGDVGVVNTSDGATSSGWNYWNSRASYTSDILTQAKLNPSKWGRLQVRLDPTSIAVLPGAFTRINRNLSISTQGMGRMITANNPYDVPLHMTLLTVNGKIIANVILQPGNNKLTLSSSLAHMAYLYRISTGNALISKGRITLM